MATLADNRRARHDYDIQETFEAGLVLQGQEVKSVRKGSVQLAGSFIAFKAGELWLIGSVIPPYQPSNAPSNYDPARPRKLLLHKSELEGLYGRNRQEGLTFVPLSVYTSQAFIKLRFGIARGKRKKDKRQLIKKREAQREMERALKRG